MISEKHRIKKVFYDPQIFYLQKFGGISKYYINLVKNLDKSLISPKIIAPITINNYLKKLDDNLKTNVLKINSHPKFTRKLSNFFNDKYFKLYCKVNKPDIIHSTYFKNTKIDNSKLVVTVYDLIYEIFQQRFKLKISKEFKQKSLENADKIICISENTKKDLLKYYKLDEKKISVILLGRPESKNYNIINDKFLDDPFILYVGDRNKYKNFRSLLKAFFISKKLSNDFNLVCFGSSPFSNDEIDYISDHNFDFKKIKFFSGDDKDLNYLYMKAELYVCPSMYEGFGLTILEAMNLDCPIIASNTSSLKEVGGNTIEYFDPNSINDMSERIESLVYNNEKKKIMINSYEHHLDNFSWKKNALETQKIYEELS